MKRFILGFISILSILALLVYIGITQSNTGDLLLKYRRQAPFSNHEMTYQYVGKPWFGKGLIFYRPQFPTLPLHLTVDRLKLILSPRERAIYLSGASIDIAETLQERDNLLTTLKSFQTPDDFLTKPLEGLALLGIDTFKGDIQILLKMQQDATYLTLRAFRRKHLVLEVKITLLSDQNSQLWGWTNASFQKGEITLYSPDLLRRIDSYYQALGQSSPSSLKRALIRNEPLTLPFHLPHQQPVSSVLKGNT